ncbi:hypothetical protein ACQEVI_18885 [Promicromonospora sp. CA-289599]|uniref:hypothetical protein n=1 Tax=Promicromonospora sp. CA-289599 TaxID=3240014 RepID=UPI003D8FDE87
MTIDPASTIRSVRLGSEQWAAALAQVAARTDRSPSSMPPVKESGAAVFRVGQRVAPSPVDILVRHGSAPVRASLVATAGSRGSVARASLVGDEALVIVQAIAERDGRVLIEPGAELRLAAPQTLWSALQAAIPPLDVLRAPANAVGHDPRPEDSDRTDTAFDDGAPWRGATLDGADAVLQIVVEAWPTPDLLARFWSRLWAVTDDTLFDVQRRGGTLTRTQRPAGSVAAELQWALAGAMRVNAE